jgi:hypothetical protein
MIPVSKQPLPLVFETFPEVYLILEEVFSTSLQQTTFKHHNTENKSAAGNLELEELHN